MEASDCARGRLLAVLRSRSGSTAAVDGTPLSRRHSRLPSNPVQGDAGLGSALPLHSHMQPICGGIDRKVRRCQRHGALDGSPSQVRPLDDPRNRGPALAGENDEYHFPRLVVLWRRGRRIRREVIVITSSEPTTWRRGRRTWALLPIRCGRRFRFLPRRLLLCPPENYLPVRILGQTPSGRASRAPHLTGTSSHQGRLDSWVTSLSYWRQLAFLRPKDVAPRTAQVSVSRRAAEYPVAEA